MMTLQLNDGGAEPEVLVPEEEACSHRSDSLQVPEKRLMLAVLEDAVAILSRGSAVRGAGTRLAVDEVRRWYASEDRRWPFSFVNICEALGFDPSGMRAALARLPSGNSPAPIAPVFRARRNLGSRTQVVVRPRPTGSRRVRRRAS